MAITKNLIILCLGIGGCLSPGALSAGEVSAGPLYADFDLTLTPGHRKEALGPAFYLEHKDSQRTWSIPPFAETEDPTIGYKEFDFAYPLLTYDQFGTEYRWQFCQLLSWAGGIDQKADKARRFTLFPFYFQQRSPDPAQNYTAMLPFYGTLKNRLFRDEIHFAMFPLYTRTRKRDIISYGTPYPFFTQSYGNGLRGWQLWPLVGHEHKTVTTLTNGFQEVETIPGHDRRFVLWPFFIQAQSEVGTDRLIWQQALIPFYSLYRSKLRDSSTYFWPFGVTHTVDREKQFTEWAAPWPLIVFDRGAGKHTDRVWPFFSRSKNQYLESDWYMWPVYKYNRLTSAPLDRERTRLFFFFYSVVNERNTETGKALHRVDCWPFFTYRRDFNGNNRLQLIALIEPLLPGNKSTDRDYSQLYSFWRDERNPNTGASSQSLLWNLYRHDSTPQTKKTSLLFGLFQYQSSLTGRQWRICYIPMGKTNSDLREPLSQR